VLLRPFLANAASRVLRLDAGEGRSVFAVERLAVVESLLPSCTVHDGPPSCTRRIAKTVMLTERSLLTDRTGLPESSSLTSRCYCSGS
jgi:hypothetical protein